VEETELSLLWLIRLIPRGIRSLQAESFNREGCDDRHRRRSSRYQNTQGLAARWINPI
jgi:hypothetical protein